MAIRLDQLIVELAIKGAAKEQLDDLQKRTDKLAKGFRTAGLALSGIGASALGAVAASSTTFGKLETNFARMKGLVGLTDNQLRRLDKGMREIGREKGAGLLDMSDALYALTSAGNNVDQALSLLRESIRATNAGLGDTMTVARLASRAIAAYGKENMSASRALDIMAFAAQKGDFSPEQLAQNLPDLLGLGATLGIELHEIGALMAGLSRTQDLNIVSTQLNALMAALIKPTATGVQMFSGKVPTVLKDDAEARKIIASIKEAGIQFNDIRDMARDEGLFATMEYLDSIFQGHTGMWGVLFENRSALVGISQLLGEARDSVREIVEEDSAGKLAEAEAPTLDTLKKAWEHFTTSMEEVRSTFGERMAPMVKRVLRFFADMGRTLSDLPGPLLQVTSVATVLSTALLPLGLGLIFVSQAIGSVTTVVKHWGRIMSVGKLLLNPWIAGLVLLAGLAFVVAANWESVKSALHDALPDWLARYLTTGDKEIAVRVQEETTRTESRIERLREALENAEEGSLTATRIQAELTTETARLAGLTQKANEIEERKRAYDRASEQAQRTTMARYKELKVAYDLMMAAPPSEREAAAAKYDELAGSFLALVDVWAQAKAGPGAGIREFSEERRSLLEDLIGVRGDLTAGSLNRALATSLEEGMIRSRIGELVVGIQDLTHAWSAGRVAPGSEFHQFSQLVNRPPPGETPAQAALGAQISGETNRAVSLAEGTPGETPTTPTQAVLGWLAGALAPPGETPALPPLGAEGLAPPGETPALPPLGAEGLAPPGATPALPPLGAQISVEVNPTVTIAADATADPEATARRVTGRVGADVREAVEEADSRLGPRWAGLYGPVFR